MKGWVISSQKALWSSRPGLFTCTQMLIFTRVATQGSSWTASRRYIRSNPLQLTTIYMLIHLLKLRLPLMSLSKILTPNFGISMALSQPYHLTTDFTSKLPVVGCWSETVASYTEEFPCLCQHVLPWETPCTSRSENPRTSSINVGQAATQSSDWRPHLELT